VLDRALRRAPAAAALALAIALAGLFRGAAQRMAPLPVDFEFDVPPIPAEVARPLAFGFPSLLADLTFVQAIQVLAMRKASMTSEMAAPIDRRLHRLLEYSVEVDPRFAGAYRFTGTALPHETVDGKAMGVLAAVSILQRGVRERPDVWQIPFLLGFLQVYYLGDFASGAVNLAVAARDPDAPSYLPFLATRVGAQGGELAISIALAETMLAQANEEETRRDWEARVADLRMERDLRAIEGAVDRFRSERAAVPPSVRALVEAGYLAAEPREPHGGRYRIARDGSVHSTRGKRLQIHGGTARLEVH
jgi:hypothetical protein